ncbi:MAG: tyrosinase [Thermomicrobiales bacterium]|nr:tyrosinase [Thermomicrobiales bacterium]
MIDTDRLDDLARRLAARRLSRRSALRGLGGTGLAAVGARLPRSVAAQEATPAVTPAGSPSVRRDARTLSPAERQAYAAAILAIKEKPSPWAMGLSVYDTFVLWHRDAFNCDINAAHMGPAFLPWHRQFLLLFEQQLRAVDPTITLPYWDWTVDNTPDSYVWGDDFMGGNGDPAQGYVVTTGPFAVGKWTIKVFDYNDTIQNPSLIRDFGGGSMAPDLPTTNDVEQALSVATYDAAPWNASSPVDQSFRNTLEGWRDCGQDICDPLVGMGVTCTGSHDLHNRVHLWVSGEFQFSHQLAHDGMGSSPAATPAATPASGEPASPESSPEIFGTMAANSSLNDPVFWLHHANVDRLWNEWLHRHGQTYLPVTGGPFGHNLNDPMWPYQQIGLTATPAMMLDSRALGYVYDTDA